MALNQKKLNMFRIYLINMEFKKYFDSMRKIDCEDGFSENKRIRHTYTYKELSKNHGCSRRVNS